mgnify:CR=1 FL=1
MLTDFRKTAESWRHDHLTTRLPGTLAASDYLGDAGADPPTGVPMPGCTLTGVHYTAGTPSGADTEVTIHNVTSGATATFTPDSAAGDADVDLHFDPGDELGVEVTGVDAGTAGGDVTLVASYEKYRVSSTQRGA